MNMAMVMFISLLPRACEAQAGPARDAGFFVGEVTLGPIGGPDIPDPYHFTGTRVLDRAPINLEPDNTSIEGGIIEGTDGGDDPMDNRGVAKYLRVEFAAPRAGFQAVQKVQLVK